MDNPNAIADAQNLVNALNERKKYWESVKNVPTARAAQAEEERKKKEAENSLPPLPENVTVGEDGSLQVVEDNNEEKAQEQTTEQPQAVEESASEQAESEAAPEVAEEANETEEQVREAEAQTDTNPTEAQKEAGNYRKGHVTIDGLDISIEQPRGSVRSGKDKDGKEWSVVMNNTYGYIRGTEGVDGDHIDIFLSDNPTEGDVFVVDQVNEDGTFDEHKVMYGFPDIESAREAYLANYSEGWQGLGAITPVSKENFKKWIDSSHRKTKPFAEYSSVETIGDVLTEHTEEAQQAANEDEQRDAVNKQVEKVLSEHGYHKGDMFRTHNMGNNAKAEIAGFDAGGVVLRTFDENGKQTAQYIELAENFLEMVDNGYLEPITEERKESEPQDKTQQNDSEGKQEEKKPQKPTSNRKKTEEPKERLYENGGIYIERETTEDDGAYEVYSLHNGDAVQYCVPDSADKRIADFKKPGEESVGTAYNAMGDYMFRSLEEAKEIAEKLRKRDAANAEYQKKVAEKEKAEAEKAEAEKERKRYGGFTDGKSPMQAANIAKVLDKLHNFTGYGTKAMYKHIEDWAKTDGVTFGVEHVPGKKTPEYYARMKDGSEFLIPKTAYDYAKFVGGKMMGEADIERSKKDAELQSLKQTYSKYKDGAKRAEHIARLEKALKGMNAPDLAKELADLRRLDELMGEAEQNTAKPSTQEKAEEKKEDKKQNEKFMRDDYRDDEKGLIYDFSNILSEAYNGKRKKLRKKLDEMKAESGRTDIFGVYNSNGEFLDVAGSAAEAYQVALNNDTERFNVVRFAGTSEDNFVYGVTSGWLFTDEIPMSEWRDADGKLKQEVKDSSIKAIENELALPERMEKDMPEDKRKSTKTPNSQETETNKNVPEPKSEEVSENDKGKGKKNERKAEPMDIGKFVSKAVEWAGDTPLITTRLGVYHDPSGFAVATDGYILVYDKRQYDESRKGQIVATRDIKKGRKFTWKKKGETIEGRYHNWQSVIPEVENNGYRAVNIDFASFAADFKKQKAQIIAEFKERNNLPESEDVYSVELVMPDGISVRVDNKLLQDYLDAADSLGATSLYYGNDYRKPLVVKSENGGALLMPCTPRNEVPTIDLSKYVTAENSESKQEDAASEPTAEEGKGKKPTAVKGKKIEDVGEKIGGARKDLAKEMSSKINTSAVTFPKMFPKFDLAKMVEKGLDPKMAATTMMLRQEAMKEYKKHKRRNDTERALGAAKLFAEYAKRALETGNTDVNFTEGYFSFSGYGKVFIQTNIELYGKIYEKMGSDMFGLDLSDYYINPLGKTNGVHRYSYRTNENGEKEQFVPAYEVHTGRGTHYFKEDELDKAHDLVVEKLKENADYEAAHPFKIDTYQQRKDGKTVYYNATRIGGEIKKLGEEYDSLNEAYKFKAEHNAELQAEAARIKEMLQGKEKKAPVAKLEFKPGKEDRFNTVISVKIGDEYVPLSDELKGSSASKFYREHKDELQKKAQQLMDEWFEAKQKAKGWKPQLSLGGVRPRKGEDYRNGKDVSAEQLMNTFGFRGIEFGNYVSQKERQQYMNETYDALMDLAGLLGVDPKALSLGGELGFAVGSRGGTSSNGATAHYEPGKNVINLTKKNGAGALAHEWWHALDFYLNRKGSERKTASTSAAADMSFNAAMRIEMQLAFNELMNKINKSDYRKRSRALDETLHPGKSTTGYYETPTELGARAFQNYVQGKLTEKGAVNDFLSTFTPDENWNGVPENYPYPRGEESGKIAEAFDNLFGTMLQREDEQTGNIILYHKAEGTAEGVSERDAMLRDAVVDKLREAGIEVVTDTEEAQRILDLANGEVRLMGEDSERRKERNRINAVIDEATAMVSHKDINTVRRERQAREAARRKQTKKIYDIILSGEYNDVSLQEINDYINDVTPYNPYGRRLSERLPQRVERKMYEGTRENAIDALFSRVSESTVRPNERVSASGRRAIEEKKKELLEQWAKASGNWHTDIKDFTDDTEPIGSGKDSDVYLSKDGKNVIKLSKGKPDAKRFRPDIDNIPLFNYVFRNSPYRIVGYGNFGNGFVRILQQPVVDFAKGSTPLTEKERVEYMNNLGFHPINKENTAFSNDTIIVADLQKGNIVKDAAGNITVIDADCKLHTKDVGGKYSYLPVEHDTYGTDIREHRVYHGTGADFDAFDHSHMGEGEGNAKIESKTRFFRTDNGEAYGFVKDGKIYLDPRIAGAQTAVHEYTHLWAEAVRKGNPEKWDEIKGVLLNDESVKPFIDEVRKKYPELTNEDELLDEVLAHYSGKRGAERLRASTKRIADSKNGVFEKADVYRAMENLKNAIRRFWEAFADFMHVPYKSVDEIADRVMYDLLSGVNPRQEVEKLQKEPHKKKQLDIVTKANVMFDDYHTGIRTIDDIKTFAEAVEYGEGMDMYPDFTEDDAREALKSGEITVYSSKPIENGVFVSASRMEAEDYAGGGKVYEKRVPLTDVAWLFANEGQYAEVNEDIRFRDGEIGNNYTKRATEEDAANTLYSARELVKARQRINSIGNIGRAGTKAFEGEDGKRIYNPTVAKNIGEYMVNALQEYKDWLEFYAEDSNATKAYKQRFADHIAEVDKAIEFYNELKDGKITDPNAIYDRDIRYREIGAPLNPRGERMTAQNTSLDEAIAIQGSGIRYSTRVNHNSPFLLKRADGSFVDAETGETLGFDHRFMGTGEGNQAHGWGSYFSAKDIRRYGNKYGVKADVLYKGKSLRDDIFAPFNYSYFFDEDGMYGGKAAAEKKYLEDIDRAIRRNNDYGASQIQKKLDLLRQSSEQDFMNATNRHHYDVEIPDNDGTNYLEEDKPLTDEQFKRWKKAMLSGLKGADVAATETWIDSLDRQDLDGEKAYFFIDGSRSSKRASKKLKKAGFTGIHYNGRSDGECYVIFDESDARIVNHERFRDAEETEQNAERDEDAMERDARAFADELGTKVRVVRDVNEIEHPDAATQNRMRESLGWFDPKSGEVVVVIPNNTDAADVRATVLHEIVGHKGLQQVVGKEKFEDFLMKVYRGVDVETRKKINELAARNHWDFYEGIEEYIAQQAERGFEDRENAGLWRKIVQYVRDLLSEAKVRLGMNLGENDVRYMLWKTYQLKKGRRGVFAEARDVALQNELGVGNYRYARGTKKPIGYGREITFTKSNPTSTFKAVAKYLTELSEKEPERFTDRKMFENGDLMQKVRIDKARTGSNYIDTTIDGVDYHIRFANHTKANVDAAEESGVAADIYKDSDLNIDGVDIDLSLADFKKADILELMDEVRKLNNADLATAKKDDYPILSGYGILTLAQVTKEQGEAYEKEQQRKRELAEYKEYRKSVEDSVKPEYDLGNGIVVRTNGSINQYGWEVYKNGEYQKKGKSTAKNAMKYVADNLISRPMQFEEWKKQREEVGTKKTSTQNREGASAKFSVVPSESGAKVAEKLESTKRNYENAPNKPRGFITNVAQALGLEQHEASQYGTFKTEDGKEFTLRISNHNASVANFDESGESEGVSIVISKYGNRGIRNNGTAHVSEFFYPKSAIERAEGKPLAVFRSATHIGTYGTEAQGQELCGSVGSKQTSW